jgi:hypothetical protein
MYVTELVYIYLISWIAIHTGTWYDSIDSEGDIEYGGEEFIGQRVQDTTEVGGLTLEVASNVPIYLKQIYVKA